jgi:hypothetical protein
MTGRSVLAPLSRPSSFWDSYLTLLALLGAGLLLFPLNDGRPLIWALRTAVFVAAIIVSYRASGSGSNTVVWVTVGAVIVGVLLLAAAFSSSDTVRGIGNLALAALIGSGPVVILRHIYTRPRVAPLDIVGALDAYIELGFFFTFLFSAVGRLSAEPFFNQTADPELFDYVYFSFVTMTSLGYGDFSPALAIGKGLVIVEVLLGSVFLVVLVARLVGTLGMERPPAPMRRDGQDGATDTDST